MLTWKRPKRESSIIADHRSYGSKCGRYRVVLVHIVYGTGPNGYPDRWVAMANGPPERIISEHRTQAAAVKACQAHARTAKPAKAKP